VLEAELVTFQHLLGSWGWNVKRIGYKTHQFLETTFFTVTEIRQILDILKKFSLPVTNSLQSLL
jgi:hypothetical protein